MKEAGIEDPHDIEAVRKLGVIDLPTIQKKANLHFSLTLDLFGNEISTNAANAFHSGLKGRFREDQLDDDHQLEERHLSGAARWSTARSQARTCRRSPALNMRLRDDYVADCNVGVGALEQGDREVRHPVRAHSCRTSRSTARSASSRGIDADVDGKLAGRRRMGPSARTSSCRRTRTATSSRA